MNLINFTSMPAAGIVVPDADGVDHVVVVIKGTFDVTPEGRTRPAAVPQPLCFADEHFGDPETSSVRYENDFAPFKPMCDLIVNGSAHGPQGRSTRTVDVRLRFGTVDKSARVVGDRAWRSRWVFGFGATRPRPFTTMPVTWERAFGGSDTTPKNPKRHAFELRNLLGIGIHSSAGGKAVAGSPLPNVEHTKGRMRSWKTRATPVGFGFVARGSQPRAGFAGTYDDAWLEDRFPFLPDDFDSRYYQGAPGDQIVPYPQGGEEVVLEHFTPQGTLRFRLPIDETPRVMVPFPDVDQVLHPVLDTVIVEPDQARVLLTWRARTPCTCKPTDVGLIEVGEPTAAWTLANESGKTFVDWRTRFPDTGS